MKRLFHQAIGWPAATRSCSRAGRLRPSLPTRNLAWCWWNSSLRKAAPAVRQLRTRPQDEMQQRRRSTLTSRSRLLTFTIFAACVTAGSQEEKRTPKVRSSQSIHCGGALLQIDFGEGTFELADSSIVQRVQDVADAVGHFYGKFPVARTRSLILPIAGQHGVLQGTTWGNRDGFSAFLRLRIGSATTTEELKDDWILTHEIVHTCTGFSS